MLYDCTVIREKLRLWKQAIVQRVYSVPSWVIVLAVAAVVGSVSAMVSVSVLARWNLSSRSVLKVPSEVSE